MKIALLTEHRPLNYGSVLQTFATQTLLEQLGHTVEVVDYWRYKDVPKNQANLALEYHPAWKKNVLLRTFFRWIFPFVNTRRERRMFNGFLKRRVHLSQRMYTSCEDLEKDCPTADFYLSGSDQLWNAGIHNTDAYYLDFLKAGEPCGSFATSFGRDQIPEEELEEIRPKLQKYRFLSVREQTGVEIVKRAGTAVEPRLVLDPTLVASPAVWRDLSDMAKPRIAENTPYLLVFQINYGTNEKLKEYAGRLAQQKQCRLVSVEFSVKYKRHASCQHILSPTPEELLRLIRHAKYVLTDSFHGTAFCLIFQKNFLVDLPPKYSGRLKNILQIAGIPERVLNGYESFSVFDKAISYTQVDSRLSPWKLESYAYLRDSLEEVEHEICK